MDEKKRKKAEALGFEFVEGKEPGEPFWPNHVLVQVIAIYVMLAILFTLAILVPWPLHARANPIETPRAIKPEWYFLSSYQLLKYMPKMVGIVVTSAGFLLLVLWPFLDRSPVKLGWKRPISMLIAGGGLTMMLTLTLLGHLSENYYKRVELFGIEFYEYASDERLHFDAKAVPFVVKKMADGQWHRLDSDGQPAIHKEGKKKGQPVLVVGPEKEDEGHDEK